MERQGMILISYYYPPIKSMGVMRSYALSHEWLKYFDSVSVITTDNNRRLQAEPLLISNDINVSAISTMDYRTLTSMFSNRSHYTESSKKSWFGQLMVKVLNSFPFNLWIGEGGYWYIRTAYREAKREIEERNIGYIFSSFRPYSDHFIARKLKKKFPHLKWIADFRDIHVDVLKNNVLLKSAQHKFNSRILDDADFITTVSHGCAEHLQKYVSKKVHVIYNGVHDTPVETALDDVFTITYTGSLYGEMRNPSVVLAAIEKLNKENCFSKGMRIVYAGKDADTWNTWIKRYHLQDYSLNKGLCSHKESRFLQASSHINLQLTFAHPEVTGAITGKLMEYIQARRPIICVINGSKDVEIESFLKGPVQVITIYNSQQDVEAATIFIKTMYDHFVSGNLAAFEVSHRALDHITWPTLANKFVGIIENTNSN